jgi:transposase-like protein
MDWETLYCPNRSCAYYGLPFEQAMLVKNGSSHGHKQGLCRACGRRIALTYGTAYFDLNADPAIFELTIRALAEGNSLRSTGRIVQIDKDTVCSWLSRAAHQCGRVTLYHWHKLHMSECQLDELSSFVHTKEQNLSAAKQWCDTYGDGWVWLAFAPL